MSKTVGGSLTCWRQTVRNAWIHPGWEDAVQNWYKWSEEMKKDKEEKVEGLHQQKSGANDQECGGKRWTLAQDLYAHSMETRSTDLEEMKKRMPGSWNRCEAKRKEWAKRWQCDESVQNVEDKPWTNEKLKKLEEALPRLKEGELEKVSRFV